MTTYRVAYRTTSTARHGLADCPQWQHHVKDYPSEAAANLAAEAATLAGGHGVMVYPLGVLA